MSLSEQDSAGSIPGINTDALFRSLNDRKRLEALASTGLLDSAPEVVFDRLTNLARRIVGTPVSLVSLVDDHRQFFKAQCGLGSPYSETRQTPLSHSFCQHVVHSTKPMIVRDARIDTSLKNNLAIRDLDVIAYLGIPIRAPGGHVIGSFCAIDNKPRNWSETDVKNMTDLTIAVESEIALRMAVEQRERDVETQDLLIGELNHRVKNLFALITAMVGVSSRETDDVQNMATRLKGRIRALARAHSLVRPMKDDDQKDEAKGGLRALLEAILAPYEGTGTIDIKGDRFPISSDAAVQLSLIFHELATNMVKYGALSKPGGQITITWDVEGDAHNPSETEKERSLYLVWEEHHPDLALSEPEKKPKGFGNRLVQGSVSGQLRGSISTDWHETGLKVTLRFPSARLSPA